MQGQVGSLERVFRLDSYLGCGLRVTFGLDASVWGLGAWLLIGDVLLEFYAISQSPEDEVVFSLHRGDSKGQQVWESLNVLIALRQWRPFWMQRRIRLHVRADNTGALALVNVAAAASVTQLWCAFGRELAARSKSSI